jgi:hypothetical protein
VAYFPFLKKGEKAVSLSPVLIYEPFDRFYVLWYGPCTIRGRASVVFCNVVRSVLSTWRTHKLVRRERNYWYLIQGYKIMYGNRSSINVQRLLKWYRRRIHKINSVCKYCRCNAAVTMVRMRAEFVTLWITGVLVENRMKYIGLLRFQFDGDNKWNIGARHMNLGTDFNEKPTCALYILGYVARKSRVTKVTAVPNCGDVFNKY